MFSLRGANGLGAAIGLALTICALPAAADDARVRILPARGGAQTTTDRLLPASAQFNIEVRLADLFVPASSEATGRIRIWPKAVRACALHAPEHGAKQYHQLGMSLTGQGTDRALSAAVPPLQVGEEFCFELDVFASISDVQLAQASQAAAKVLSKKLVTAPDCLTALTADDFAAALDAAIKDTLPKRVDPAALAATSGDIKQAAGFAYQAFQIDGMKACGDAQNILDKLTEMDEAQLPALNQVQHAARATLASKLAPVGLTEPFVSAGTAVSLVGQLIDVKKTPAALSDAATQLDARTAKSKNIYYGKWATVLRQLGEALGKAGTDAPAQKKAVDTAAAAARELRKTTSLPIEIWTGKMFMPIAEVQANPAKVRTDLVLAQLDLLGGLGVIPAAQKTVAQALADAFKRKSSPLPVVT